MPSSYDSHLRAATAVALTGSDQQAVSGSAIFMGLVVTDEAAGITKVHVHNGTDNTGAHVGALGVAANGQDEKWFGPNGVHCPDGIFVDVVSGTPSGSILYR